MLGSPQYMRFEQRDVVMQYLTLSPKSANSGWLEDAESSAWSESYLPKGSGSRSANIFGTVTADDPILTEPTLATQLVIGCYAAAQKASGLELNCANSLTEAFDCMLKTA